MDKSESKSAGPRRKTLYWSVDIHQDSYQKLLALPQLTTLIQALGTFKVNSKFHVTLLYLGGKAYVGKDDSDKTLETLSDHEGRSIELLVTHVVHDEHAIALRVDKASLPVPCANQEAHITFALAPQVKPVYSNQLLGKRDRWTDIEGEIVLTGKVVQVI